MTDTELKTVAKLQSENVHLKERLNKTIKLLQKTVVEREKLCLELEKRTRKQRLIEAE